MKDQWAETLFNLKLIVNRLSSRDARTTDKPGAEVSARALEAAVVAFRKLEWTPELAKEMRALLAALSDACSKNDVLSTNQRMQDRLEAIIAGVEQWQEGTFLSLSQLEKAIKGFGNVTVTRQRIGTTCGLQLPLVRGAVNSCIHLIPQKSHREKYLKTIKKWKKSIDRYH
ncbi:hypothetical protein GQ600_20629 [Phytophthora cactorum]|nr:hypothetical protein GQ600_20629 [Phytophthora cactorum]